MLKVLTEILVAALTTHLRQPEVRLLPSCVCCCHPPPRTRLRCPGMTMSSLQPSPSLSYAQLRLPALASSSCSPNRLAAAAPASASSRNVARLLLLGPRQRRKIEAVSAGGDEQKALRWSAQRHSRVQHLDGHHSLTVVADPPAYTAVHLLLLLSHLLCASLPPTCSRK